jgi:hypothetical protein
MTKQRTGGQPMMRNKKGFGAPVRRGVFARLNQIAPTVASTSHTVKRK